MLEAAPSQSGSVLQKPLNGVFKRLNYIILMSAVLCELHKKGQMPENVPALSKSKSCGICSGRKALTSPGRQLSAGLGGSMDGLQ